MANNNIEGQILAGDKTILDVFAEKSKDADDAIEFGMGLSPEELLDLAISVTPMGRAKAGKGAISFLKGLLGKAKSQSKFPVGYGYPTKSVGKLGIKKAPTSTHRLIDEMENVAWGHPERATEIEQILLKRFAGNTKKLGRAIDDYYKNIESMKPKASPKGMRKVGVRAKD